MKATVDLLTATDARNFRVGMPVYIENGRVLRGWRLRLYLLRMRWQRLTRWWRPRTVVTAVDQEHGGITVEMERWSWRRWRWERA